MEKLVNYKYRENSLSLQLIVEITIIISYFKSSLTLTRNQII